jgi:hypothetical protein
MLVLRSPIAGAAGPSGALEYARIAARTVNYYDLDSLQIAYRDGSELLASRTGLVLHGPRPGFPRRRKRILRATIEDLLQP